MKKTILLLHALITVSAVFAAPRISAINNGNWNNTATWNLARVPIGLDTIIIPAGRVVTVSNNQSLGDVYMMVHGALGLSTGKLMMGANSIVMVLPGGTIMGTGSNSEKMRIGTNEVFRGSDAAITGPVFADKTTGAGFTAFTLPVKFLGFSVNTGRDAVLVQWSTAEETNADHYEVERSLNGNDWSMLALVPATGNSVTITNYSYTDKSKLVSITYYRIKQVDVDGRFIYTPVKVIRHNADELISTIKITVIQGKIVLQFPEAVTSPLVIRLVSLSGQVINKQYLNNAFGQVILNMGNSIRGNIVVSIDNGQEIHVAKQVIL